ncbi:macrophage mannose receptor 1-like [Dunckerocampus dactyliophorus]|uniref:macrophage mannose receptor 1-like n=1 Tax=Dunckerocampus dactyliophorus TaxID=161453 RepID=UPI00240737DD|nr:macrophage mannose receptor 1-like [Dunckerocampus dactyliophorus]XP_054655055.1 macrophage mannose receptor 1-like [Dunckerocampus dactyliophorus]XP_054655067.1 macrophage mannose receptor 1-like [Dunckerocampus dactyliophorus]XP_054655078.1 macrophage mannose receptor 1-like [Dunckerocampus dactyliophorus]XP_054655087.1 macrophage mannose receptor 1-like [Dunckerocampus dactyliophorus]XP_054655097.1 macrophage mannose receptor 1-like [Dunckerocampus dactyliophorus]
MMTHTDDKMEKVLLAIIAASGVCVVWSCGQRRFHFISEPKSWNEALLHCRAQYHDLASVHSKEDVKAMMDSMDPSGVPDGEQLAWIGLYDDRLSWTWSSSGQRLGKSSNFSNWAAKEPNSKMNREHCVVMYDNGYWNDANCHQSRQAVCVENSTGVAILILKNLTWAEARNFCRKHRWDLATVFNEEDNRRIMQQLHRGQEAWIGLSRDSWKWCDGSNVTSAAWQTGQPDNRSGNESCVAADLNNTSQWHDRDCDSQRAFICYDELQPKSKRLVRVSVVRQNSSVDLNEAAVVEDILEQLERRLQCDDSIPHIKLSWIRQSDGKVFHEKTPTTVR